ncbi:MAG: MerR family transcriptional regulator [Gammaproteobacteria bacterium]|nr:MerR family transcriptional regulator [Gammaproteobacteria bacterium]
MLRIGEVANKSHVGVETVRFYEREGLIALPKRNVSGYRQYSESAIKQIQFIQHAKTLGFSLKDIRELIKLKSTRDARCKSIKSTAKAKIADIQEKIDALKRMKMALEPLVAQCKSSDPISDCPILNALDETANE